MVKLLIYVLLVLVVGFGFAWLADRPGDMVITWQGQQIEMSLMVGVSLVVALIVAILLVWWLVRTLLASPHLLRRHFRARRRDRGYQALSTGLIAAGAGDAMAARKMHRRTRGLISAGQEPLVHLLEAQTALIEGDHAAARAKFESMAEDPETRTLALRGLYLEARRLGSEEAARHYVERAVDAAPQLPWAAQAALEYRSRESDWDGALRLLEKQRMARVVNRDEADRKKAVLLTARAMRRLDGDFRGAQADATEALRLAPGLVPAAVTAARALFREDNLRKGSRVLEKIWREQPHPEIAETYVRARIGDSVHDRLKRAEKLDALKPNHIESLLVVAHAALDAQQFARAREKAEAAARMESREGIYLLLADIEEAETGDQGRVRHWLSQAVRAQRDPAWTADGYVAEKWEPVSPVTGKLDAFTWRVPVERLSGPVEEGRSTTSDAEEAIRSLPPVRVEAVSRPPDDAVTVEAEPVKAAREDVPAEKPVEHEDAAENRVDAAPSAKPDHGKDVRSTTIEAESTTTPAKKPEPASKPANAAGDATKEKSASSPPRPPEAAPAEKDGAKPAGKSDDGAFRRPPDDPGIEDGETAGAPRKRFGLF